MHDELYDELAGIGYGIMESLREAFPNSKLEDVDDGVCYQRLNLQDGNAIYFQKWGPKSNWKMPFYLIPKIKGGLGNAGDRVCQLNLSLIRPVGDEYQWYLKRPQRMVNEYEQCLGGTHEFPEDYRQYVLNSKAVLGAGNDRPAKGYILADNASWVELINNLVKLVVACYRSVDQEIKTKLISEEEALNDSENFVNRLVRNRKNQCKFRWVLRKSYSDQCAITGDTPHHALEACHIQDHSEEGNNQRSNGILLRADLHNLFDKGLIKINPETFKVEVASTLESTPYWDFDGTKIRKTVDGQYPSQEFLKIKYEE